MFVAAHSAWAGLAAQAIPSKMHVIAKAGTPKMREILLSNDGADAVVVNVHLADWRLDTDGNMVLLDPGVTPSSLAGHVTFEPNNFSLQPGESGRVRITLTLPETGPATLWGVVLSEVRPATYPANHLGPKFAAQLGTTIYASRATATPARSELIGMQVLQRGVDSLAVALTMRNEGERDFYATTRVMWADSAGHRIAEGTIGTGVVLPNDRRTFTWAGRLGLAPGTYLVTAEIDTGEPELLVGEAHVQWPLRPRETMIATDDAPR
jgi:P pilus assembly chaperone PapD